MTCSDFPNGNYIDYELCRRFGDHLPFLLTVRRTNTSSHVIRTEGYSVQIKTLYSPSLSPFHSVAEDRPKATEPGSSVKNDRHLCLVMVNFFTETTSTSDRSDMSTLHR